MTRHGQTIGQAWAFLAPAFLYVTVFSLLPILVAGWLSLHEWQLLKAARPFVGLAQYRSAVADPLFRNALFNSFVFTVFSVPLGMALALAAAVLVNRRMRGMAVFRTLFYVPSVSSGVAMAMVWIWVFMPYEGLINRGLQWFGGSGDTDFLNDPHWAMPALIVMSAVIGLGPRMVIFLAGLEGIPESLGEAAQVDGCTAWQRFRHITWPMLAPSTFFVLVTSTISALQMFTPVYVMTRGGPRGATDVVVYHIYREAWHRFDLGMASAQSYVLLALTLLAATAQFVLMRRQLRNVESG